MNKYVKLKDAMEVHRQFAINGRLASNIMEKYDNLPTIEIDEDSISRKWVLNEIITKVENDDSLTTEQQDSLSAAKYLIKHAPPVVPSRAEGEWIDKGDYAECSLCGADSGTQFNGVEPVPRKTKFCPECGVKMKRANDVER